MKKQTTNKLAALWVVVGVLGRLIPHLPNVTPFVSLSMYAGKQLSRKLAFLILFIALFISDASLALLNGYPIFSYWTLFTYSGFAAIVFVSRKFNYQAHTLPFYILGSSFLFWVWTNFGVWLTGNLYPKTFLGLEICYYAALPFLRNSLIGDLIWGSVIFYSWSFVTREWRNRQTRWI